MYCSPRSSPVLSTNISSFHLHNNPLGSYCPLISYYRWENWRQRDCGTCSQALKKGCSQDWNLGHLDSLNFYPISLSKQSRKKKKKSNHCFLFNVESSLKWKGWEKGMQMSQTIYLQWQGRLQESLVRTQPFSSLSASQKAPQGPVKPPSSCWVW